MDARRGQHLTGTTLADRLIPYVVDMGFTHLELLPITEHPFGGSWGYQPLGLFAPTGALRPPEAFARFVDRAAMPPASASSSTGCRRISRPMRTASPASTARRSTSIADPREGFHHDWNTCIYNFGRREVQGFLIASALHWLEHFHVDGLRVDAVASMLYRDYSRRPASGCPTSTAAARTSRRSPSCSHLNAVVARTLPRRDDDRRGIDRLARRHPAGRRAAASASPTNGTWAGCTTRSHYMAHDPIHRRYHHDEMTFGLLYAFSERFVLPLVA